MKPVTPTIALSTGEPAGIGPDICLTLGLESRPTRIAVLADPDLLAERAEQLGLPLRIDVRERAADVQSQRAGSLQVLPIALRKPVRAGCLDPGNAEYVLEMLHTGAELCRQDDCQALVTAPVQKSVINEAGIPFSGHTEFLAELCNCPHPVMMLAGNALRVALATTHLALRDVPDAITTDGLLQTLTVIDMDLRRRFGLDKPRILVLGLNPHAGESGTLGREELDILQPAIAAAAARGIAAIGPVSADTAFSPDSLRRCDIVLAMYHDQGLPVLKTLEFGGIVNVTLGLSILRTSVDHGTALDLAGTGRAKADSLRAALQLAEKLAAA